MARTERVLFACHAGAYGGRRAGVVVADHALPIAVGPSSHGGESPSEDGVCALWEYHGEVEQFFSVLGIDHVEDRGLWVAVVENRGGSEELGEDAHDDWDHLVVVGVRRPSEDECAALARGEAPWPDGVLL